MEPEEYAVVGGHHQTGLVPADFRERSPSAADEKPGPVVWELGHWWVSRDLDLSGNEARIGCHIALEPAIRAGRAVESAHGSGQSE
jgi:hypothetical protein